MVFQHYALFPHLNVVDNVSYGLRQRSPRPSTLRSPGGWRALAMVRLSGLEGRRSWELSGGQQQRVALARALINRPSVLLLDEPLAALDRKLRREMQIELQNLQRNIGITFLLVTHDQEEALSMTDRVCIMREGRIVQAGTPRELYDEPVNRYVADFVGKSNFFAGARWLEAGIGARRRRPLGDGSRQRRLPATERAAHCRVKASSLAVRPELMADQRPKRGPPTTSTRLRARGRGTASFSASTPNIWSRMKARRISGAHAEAAESETGSLELGDTVPGRLARSRCAGRSPRIN